MPVMRLQQNCRHLWWSWAMSEWVNTNLGQAANLVNKKPTLFKGTTQYLATSDVVGFSAIPSETVSFPHRPSRADVFLSEGDVLQAKMKGTNKAYLVSNNMNGWLASTGFAQFKPSIVGNCSHYIYNYISGECFLKERDRLSVGSTQQAISDKDLRSISISLPSSIREQKKIASILSSCNASIKKTEELIDKYQQIKAGLMHDLFTRGIAADGKLRPPREQAPELYQETPIGWIPKDWNCENIETIKDSLVDGPFGSNLKTEHYVIDPEVRVVRLQNIVASKYNDSDKAYVSQKHANTLLRNKVIGGDVLIAGLGEERYPVGRACIYPSTLPPAINKADCFRLRCNQEKLSNKFLMGFLNTSMARDQIRKYEQGVTRPRINLGNMNRIRVPVPSRNEQIKIVHKFDNLSLKIETEVEIKDKYNKRRLGLMHDLLTGKVPVTIVEHEAINESL